MAKPARDDRDALQMEVDELRELRDKLTDTLETIAMFDLGRSGDLACDTLKAVGCWSENIKRVQPVVLTIADATGRPAWHEYKKGDIFTFEGFGKYEVVHVDDAGGCSVMPVD